LQVAAEAAKTGLAAVVLAAYFIQPAKQSM
jgi:hypothetical protein